MKVPLSITTDIQQACPDHLVSDAGDTGTVYMAAQDAVLKLAIQIRYTNRYPGVLITHRKLAINGGMQ